MFTPGLRGKLPVQPTNLSNFTQYTKGTLPKPPAAFDYGHKVSLFPMAANDQYGDCTIAGVIHMLQLAYAEVGKVFQYPGDQAVIDTYMRLSGGADTGLILIDVLREWYTNGLFGVKLAGWAPVDIHNWDEMRSAAYCFGGLYVGVEMPANAEQQFERGQNWHVDEHTGSPVGGHCVTLSGLNRFGADLETWGAETGLTKGWWQRFGSEAYVVIPEVFVETGHGPLANIDIKTLQSDLRNV